MNREIRRKGNKNVTLFLFHLILLELLYRGSIFFINKKLKRSNVFQFTERAEREVKQLKADVESKNRDIERLNVAKNKIQTNVGQLESSLSESRIMTEGLEKRLEAVNSTVGDLQIQIDTQASAIATLEQENEKKAGEIITKVGCTFLGNNYKCCDELTFVTILASMPYRIFYLYL